MNMYKAVRWQQRLINLRKAFSLLSRAVTQEVYNDLERAGLIQQFEFCFELSWKTLKDYLENEGILAETPREVIKQAFAANLLPDVDVWIDVLEKRNLLSHVYDDEMALFAITLIKSKFFPILKRILAFFNEQAYSPAYGIELLILLKLLEHFSKYPQIQEITLFGSRAMGNFKATSDIDLAISGPLSDEQFARLKAAIDEEEKIPFKVDLIHLEKLTNQDMKDHIKNFGKVLYP
jgi:nucleotidyltransferase substrate binding protein (TIGR01987 family)